MTETIQAGDTVAWLRDGGRKGRELGRRWAVQISELVRES